MQERAISVITFIVSDHRWRCFCVLYVSIQYLSICKLQQHFFNPCQHNVRAGLASGTEHRGLNDNEETSANKIGREKRGMKSDIEDKLAFCDNTER